MKKQLIGVLAAIIACGIQSAQAQQVQQAVNTANGKVVKRITFDREQVNIVYADGTTDEGVQQATIRPGDVTMTDDKTFISSPATKGGKSGYYTLDGRKVVNGKLPKGVYVERKSNGVRKIVKK